jgi:hypothetical protein
MAYSKQRDYWVQFQDPILFPSTEGQGKGFKQKKYEEQVLHGILSDICKAKYNQSLGDF